MVFRTGSGFTDYVPDVTPKGEVLETGSATVAAVSYEKEVASLGKSTIGGGSQIMTDVAHSSIADGLQQARAKAFNDFLTWQKKGQAAVNTGKLPQDQYQLSLLNELTKLETKWPGYAEELNKQKKAMGIQPRADIVANEAALRESNRRLVLTTATSLGTLTLKPDGTPDMEKIIEDTRAVQEANAFRSKLSAIASQQGISDPSKHSNKFLLYHPHYTKSMLDKAVPLENAVLNTVGNIVKSGKQLTKDDVATLMSTITAWENTELGDITKAGWTGKDEAHFIGQVTSTASRLRAALVGGEGKPQGVIKNLEYRRNLRRLMSTENYFKLSPMVDRLIAVFGEEAVAKWFSADLFTMALKSGDLTEESKKLRTFLTTVDHITKPPSEGSNASSLKDDLAPKELKGSAKHGLQIFSSIIHKGAIPNNPERMEAAFRSLDPVILDHLNGTLKPEESLQVSKLFKRPQFLRILEAAPSHIQERVGAFAFNILEGSFHKLATAFKTAHTAITPRGVEWKNNKLKFVLPRDIDKLGGHPNVIPGAMTASLTKTEDDLNQALDYWAKFAKYKKDDALSSDLSENEIKKALAGVLLSTWKARGDPGSALDGKEPIVNLDFFNLDEPIILNADLLKDLAGKAKEIGTDIVNYVATHYGQGHSASKAIAEISPAEEQGSSAAEQTTLTYANGAKYVGEIAANTRNRSVPEGQGTMTWADGDKYVGEFKDNEMHGQGTYTYANGDTYVGEHKDGKKHGQGTYTHADGTVTEGMWEKGKLIGEPDTSFLEQIRETFTSDDEEPTVEKEPTVDTNDDAESVTGDITDEAYNWYQSKSTEEQKELSVEWAMNKEELDYGSFINKKFADAQGATEAVNTNVEAEVSQTEEQPAPPAAPRPTVDKEPIAETVTEPKSISDKLETGSRELGEKIKEVIVAGIGKVTSTNVVSEKTKSNANEKLTPTSIKDQKNKRLWQLRMQRGTVAELNKIIALSPDSREAQLAVDELNIRAGGIWAGIDKDSALTLSWEHNSKRYEPTPTQKKDINTLRSNFESFSMPFNKRIVILATYIPEVELKYNTSNKKDMLNRSLTVRAKLADTIPTNLIKIINTEGTENEIHIYSEEKS